MTRNIYPKLQFSRSLSDHRSQIANEHLSTFCLSNTDFCSWLIASSYQQFCHSESTFYSQKVYDDLISQTFKNNFKKIWRIQIP